MVSFFLKLCGSAFLVGLVLARTNLFLPPTSTEGAAAAPHTSTSAHPASHAAGLAQMAEEAQTVLLQMAAELNHTFAPQPTAATSPAHTTAAAAPGTVVKAESFTHRVSTKAAAPQADGVQNTKPATTTPAVVAAYTP